MKITTLIPAYKTKYSVELFTSLIHQTHRPDHIIVSDDSPRGQFSAWLRSEPVASLLRELDLTVVQGPRLGSSYANVRHLVRTWDGRSELVHLLFDDDVLYPDFYERHLVAHRSGHFACTSSRRWTALENAQPVTKLRIPAEVLHHPQRMVALSAGVVFSTTIPHCLNWLGEFSNAVMRSHMGDVLAQARLHGVPYDGLEDIGMFLSACEKSPLCFIQDTLGAFRHGPDQNTAQVAAPVMMKAHLAWVGLALGALRGGRLSEALAYDGIAHLRSLVEGRYAEHAGMGGFRGLIADLVERRPDAPERFLAAWEQFVATQ